MNKKAALGIYLVVLSTLFIFFCSAGTSPIYWHSYFGWDADVFMMGGKLVKEGMIPYKEVFDHKGPLMFFIQYIGQMICDKRLGIFILQIIFMFFSLLGVNRLAKLFFKEAGSIVMPFLSLIFLFQYYKEGNQTEEYCLPFLIWSYYFAAKYLMGDEKAIHKPVFSLFYGITFMVCALTRITNAFPLCAILLVGFVVMCKRKQWKMIWDNILAFFMGCILLLLPFVIYFWGNGGLYDMFYGTILYNIQYAEKTDLFATLVKVVSNPTWLLPQFMPLIVSFILDNMK